MTDILLESVRALVLLVIVVFLWRVARDRRQVNSRGWNLIVLGFVLLLFGSLLDITDNFESLNRFVVIGDTETEAFFEKFVGFLGGFLLLVIGLVRWIPSVQRMQRELEARVEERTGELIQEITERKRAEKLLEDTQRQLERSLDAANVGTWEWNLQDDTHYWDERNKSMFGVAPDEYEGFVLPDFWNRIHPDDLEQAKNAVEDSLKNGKSYNHDFRIVWPDGSVRWLNSRADITRDDDGTPLKMLGACLDITEHKQMEDALRQAQKMQVVGQLTGGVAHDFNNLLSIVIGNLEMAADHLQPNTPVFEYVRNAFAAAERGALLTHHLLAFARQQVLRPKETNLATLISETKELMSVSMGEKIVMELHTGDNLWHCKVDQVQLQNAILNLSINARDAMPSGGGLTISAENTPIDTERAEVLELDEGDYVCLSVSDTGTGIPAEVLEHVYEPFFTTKGVGEGSGLGLSMVYGFVQQSGGSVDIETCAGEGTTVRLYFPATVTDKAAVAKIGAETQVERTIPDATILLVEDNAAFREITRTILESLNFQVIDFGTAEEALTVIGDTTPFDLLLSDVGLPGRLDGHDLAEYAVSARPGLKVVLMSAHADRGGSGGIIDHNISAFLRKPHRKADLAQTLHRVL